MTTEELNLDDVYWYFAHINDEGQPVNDMGDIIEMGVSYSIDSRPVTFKTGFRASDKLYNAMAYGKSLRLCPVNLGGEVVCSGDQSWGQEATYIDVRDVAFPLREFNFDLVTTELLDHDGIDLNLPKDVRAFVEGKGFDVALREQVADIVEQKARSTEPSLIRYAYSAIRALLYANPLKSSTWVAEYCSSAAMEQRPLDSHTLAYAKRRQALFFEYSQKLESHLLSETYRRSYEQ